MARAYNLRNERESATRQAAGLASNSIRKTQPLSARVQARRASQCSRHITARIPLRALLDAHGPPPIALPAHSTHTLALASL